MKFSDLAWAALCYFYHSCGDNKYVEIFSDTDFLNRLREDPGAVSAREFEEKAILGFIKIENYDLLIKHRLTLSILQSIQKMEHLLYLTRGQNITTADLRAEGPESVSGAAEAMYHTLNDVNGLWSTGASKIMHLLNDKLFPIISPGIIRDTHTPQFSMANYMRRIQYQAVTACEDFHQKKQAECTVDAFLSEKMGYTARGCRKSLVKFIDEYYFLFTSGLPVPPAWRPDEEDKEVSTARMAAS